MSPVIYDSRAFLFEVDFRDLKDSGIVYYYLSPLERPRLNACLLQASRLVYNVSICPLIFL